MMPFQKWLGRKGQHKSAIEQLDQTNIPQHVAVIMDGNGRWAQSRGMPRIAGHHAGMKNVKKIALAASRMGIKVLTLYAFSTENWKRPKEEVEYLMKLPLEFFPLEIDELIANNMQIRMTGWKNKLPIETLRTIENAIERTVNNTGLILNFAINYGSRNEIVSGIQHIVSDVLAGSLSPEKIDEQTISKYMLTQQLPDPDLLIRTSGELRISNFMLWQLAYAELWFTDLCWPEFTEDQFIKAIEEYQQRCRRFGGL